MDDIGYSFSGKNASTVEISIENDLLLWYQDHSIFDKVFHLDATIFNSFSRCNSQISLNMIQRRMRIPDFCDDVQLRVLIYPSNVVNSLMSSRFVSTIYCQNNIFEK